MEAACASDVLEKDKVVWLTAEARLASCGGTGKRGKRGTPHHEAGTENVNSRRGRRNMHRPAAGACRNMPAQPCCLWVRAHVAMVRRRLRSSAVHGRKQARIEAKRARVQNNGRASACTQRTVFRIKIGRLKVLGADTQPSPVKHRRHLPRRWLGRAGRHHGPAALRRKERLAALGGVVGHRLSPASPPSRQHTPCLARKLAHSYRQKPATTGLVGGQGRHRASGLGRWPKWLDARSKAA